MPTCEICSGVDFICESGFYYCAECQTQSQDFREEVVDDYAREIETDENPSVKKKPKSVSSESSVHETMTSWEGFNFALIGLVDQLIQLGAKPALKKVVFQLWVMYLRRMDVAFHSTDDAALPKLGPNFKKSDAELIYGYECEKRTRKRKRGTSEDGEEASQCGDTTILDRTLQRKMLTGSKRKFIKQEYEKAMLDMCNTSKTLTDVTLDMLSMCATEEEELDKKDPQFNDLAKTHGTKVAKNRLLHHPGLLLRNRLIAFIYLGLSLCGDNIRLSDLIRWINEGHVWYGRLPELFPCDVVLGPDNSKLFREYQPIPSYSVVLEVAGRITHYLHIKEMILPAQNRLIQHYIKELNLPDQVGLLTERLLNLLPRTKANIVLLNNLCIPNYEGRAMAHIIVVLKLLFGLDDASEYRNSAIAKEMNRIIELSGRQEHLFVWEEWKRFCTFRQTALLMFNRATYCKRVPCTSTLHNPQSFITEFTSINHTCNTVKRTELMIDTMKRVMNKIQYDGDMISKTSKVQLPPCLTPLSTYSKMIADAYANGDIETDSTEWGQLVKGLKFDMLTTDFSSAFIDYLTHPESFVDWAQKSGLVVGLHSGTAASDVSIVDADNMPLKRERLHCRVKVLFGEKKDELLSSFSSLFNISLNSSVNASSSAAAAANSTFVRAYKNHKPIILPKALSLKTDDISIYPVPFAKEVEIVKKVELLPGEKRKLGRPRVIKDPVVKKKSGRPEVVSKVYNGNVSKEDEEKMFYLPCTEYWIKHFNEAESKDWKSFSEQLPQSFVWLIDECAALLQMPPAYLYREVRNLEVLHGDLFGHLSSKASLRLKDNPVT